MMDLLLSRYSNIDYVMNMDMIDGVDLINKAMEEKEEQRIWSVWLARLSNMDKKNYVSFEQYKRKIMNPKITNPTITVEEQIKEAECVKSRDRKR